MCPGAGVVPTARPTPPTSQSPSHAGSGGCDDVCGQGNIYSDHLWGLSSSDNMSTTNWRLIVVGHWGWCLCAGSCDHFHMRNRQKLRQRQALLQVGQA